MSTNENTITQLYEELATLESRISLLEGTSAQKGEYFESIVEQFEKPKCCSPCDSGNGGGGSGGDNTINCENAISSMSFSYIAGVWDIYVDDMESVAAGGNIGPAISQISTLYAGRLFCDYDGVMFIQNTDSEVHRVKLVPLSYTSFTANTEVNPSYVEHPDGSLTFCLAIGS